MERKTFIYSFNKNSKSLNTFKNTAVKYPYYKCCNSKEYSAVNYASKFESCSHIG